MKPLMTALAVTTALTVPGMAMAKPITLTTTLNDYGGLPAFLAFYVTDKDGAYVGTMWLSGTRARYFEHLTGWYRTSGGDFNGVSGRTGASVGSGQTLTLNMNVPDSIFDAGFTLHIDAAAEQMRAVTNDVSVPLTTSGSGQTVHGRGFIADFAYKL
jgi:Predicted periplasmic protein (DUF2271)